MDEPVQFGLQSQDSNSRITSILKGLQPVTSEVHQQAPQGERTEIVDDRKEEQEAMQKMALMQKVANSRYATGNLEADLAMHNQIQRVAAGILGLVRDLHRGT